jgi:hypothetical protein
MHPANDAVASLTEEQVGLVFFFVSIGYCALIVLAHSIARRKLAILKSLLRHLLDGLTFATGVTVGLALFYQNIFSLVATNFVYVTVTSGTCILGPLINIAERYGWLIET